MGIRMRVHDDEPIGLAVRRFKKLVVRAGVLMEKRKRVYFIPATRKRRAKKFQKRFKARQATLLEKKAGKQSVASLAEASAEFWKRTGKP